MVSFRKWIKYAGLRGKPAGLQFAHHSFTDNHGRLFGSAVKPLFGFIEQVIEAGGFVEDHIGGGKILFEVTPEDLLKMKGSFKRQFLKEEPK